MPEAVSPHVAATFSISEIERFIPIVLREGNGGPSLGTGAPTHTVMERLIGSKKFVDTLVSRDPGKLFHLIFIGDRKALRVKEVSQTDYDKSTTTMSALAMKSRSRYGDEAIQDLLNSFAEFFKFKKEAKKKVSVFNVLPPTIPQIINGRHRYAASNMLRTDGIQAHLLGFDLVEPRYKVGSRQIVRIARRFPDESSMKNAFGKDFGGSLTTGVDPGEVIAASFALSRPGYRTK